MGLFSFIGKAAKAIGGLVGGPVGGVLKLGGGLLAHKGGQTAHAKYSILANQQQAVSRGKGVPLPIQVFRRSVSPLMGSASVPVPRQVYSETPTMPGGGVATSSGIVPQAQASPPQSFGGSGRSASGKRSRSSTRRRPTSRPKKKTGRKLKFGSPAWRAKYLKKKKRKRSTR
jgi:hypothetical protein